MWLLRIPPTALSAPSSASLDNHNAASLDESESLNSSVDNDGGDNNEGDNDEKEEDDEMKLMLLSQSLRGVGIDEKNKNHAVAEEDVESQL